MDTILCFVGGFLVTVGLGLFVMAIYYMTEDAREA